MSFVRKETEYYNVAISEQLQLLIKNYRKLDPVLSTMDDRKLILYAVHKAIEGGGNIFTEPLDLSKNRNIKLKKTRDISYHFEEITKKYREYGIEISSRQYFHRLVISHMIEAINNKEQVSVKSYD
ncbi:hypothetical protein DC365_18150 [Vibrio vulnificus]|uniref:hypothetical protein n=1 Tax=Vibrio TaxID=662 RepID=UPI000D3E4A94|nr:MULTISPECIES: hypothetical protein [Vibrio]MBE4472905.1 hypothetical protein [Vibrio parahaemolyticus]MDF4815370.1 hypothetical protein [Vibrio parahaemolyticus]PUZ94613.1 hypothetical protein DC365_18150 [Vibrio vulnificus]UJW97363.1 hypothetical protein JHS95_20050 [Vibrio parahaemolyticus]HAS6388796.1 hypothetical protein [Vibrio vulnificus]